ncbi:MAG: GNAT family N-acetyltransferase [Geodermatophilaceae bacterium]|nr:GNAT family N-acetyltransferase [Geodermatophilaceae bacterium]
MRSRPVRGPRGKRVYLRPLEPTDADLVHRWYADVRVHTLMGDPPISLASRRHRYEQALKDDRDVFRFIVCLLVDDRAIGRTDVFDLDRQNGSCAFGITIGEPDLWGQGFGTDAVNAVVDFAFGQLRMERVWLDTDEHNNRAQAAYAKAGFTREGRFRRAYFQDGRWSDDIRMALLRTEWEALPRARSWDLAAAEYQE